MPEKMTEVYEAYDMEVLWVGRGRGAIILNTDKGIRQVSPLSGTEKRLKEEKSFKEKLYQQGFENIDRCVENKEGELVTYDRYGNPFVVREYFDGRECSPTDICDLERAAENLACFHVKGRELFSQEERTYAYKTPGNFVKKNQEMKKTRSFISKRPVKNEFELSFIKAFDYFYGQAQVCQSQMDMCNMSAILGHIGYCHGTYNYHSILFCGDYIATINFDRFHVGYQIGDLYQLIRKVMEKNNYNFDMVITILEAYSKVIPLCKCDYEFIYLLYNYPEKFWKISNRYINSRKSWISPQNLEKLKNVICQEEKKLQMLTDFSNYYGVHKSQE